MPTLFLNLQLFGEEGMAESTGVDSGIATTDVAENPTADGVATEGVGDQVAPEGESWESMIKGKYKKDYDKSIKDAVNKRFKNQQNLQKRIDGIDPLVRLMAQKYGVNPEADGSINIDALTSRIQSDDSMYEQEAFQRGMSVQDLKQIKQLEMENAQLRRASQRTQEQREWDELMIQGEQLKQMYPSFDMDTEMQNPEFGRQVAFHKGYGAENPVKKAYESVHFDDIMSGAMQYAVQQTDKKISNAIQSGMRRPTENGTKQTASATVGDFDPSKLTKAQIEDFKRRAERGERITF